ncbi:MAG: Na+/H+ antiporter NhaC family protein [Pseudomonadales bacterium]|nr:Na+/H+ antiporter NhaC family protein [Pseudomonadales bacterium]
MRQSLPSFTLAATSVAVLFAWLVAGLFILEAGLHGLLLTALIGLIGLGLSLGAPYHTLRKFVFDGLAASMPALIIFILIGVVIASFIQSGTVGTLVYYGLQLLRPEFFLPAGLLLCSFMSFATGTSWGTVATCGIVLMSVGESLGFPLPLTAGMVIAGASFGDKMSPTSDTTNLAAMSAGTNLYRHIHAMSLTTGPSYLIALAIFAVLGSAYGAAPADQTAAAALLAALDASFTIHWITLIPIALMLILGWRRVPPEAVLIAASCAALIIAWSLQGASLTTLLSSLYAGVSRETGSPLLDTLINRGGIGAMAWTLTLAILAIGMGALLSQLNLLKALITPITQRIKRPAQLLTASTAAAVASNAALTEPYAAIILNGQVFQDVYDRHNIDRAMLSRTLEEGSTLTAALIPWTTTAIFYGAILGVSSTDYAPFALLNWMNPLFGIAMAWLGLGYLTSNVNVASTD